MIATGYVDCDAPLAVFLITTAVGFSGISFAGWSVNHLDLAPPYAGENHKRDDFDIILKKYAQIQPNRALTVVGSSYCRNALC